MDDSDLNKKTDLSSILYQASVFNNVCRIYAPRYRQTHIKSFYTDSSIVRPYFNIAYNDVRNAFTYFLAHYYKGGPLIIAGHSQGALHAKWLLKEFFDGKELQKKLVCAYLIGMPIESTYYEKIEPCRDSASTGCYVSWRTFRNGYTPEFVKKEKFVATVVNPLTWTMSDQYSSYTRNVGGVMFDFNKIMPRLVDAQIKIGRAHV